MNREKFIELLKGKIESRERWLEILREVNLSESSAVRSAPDTHSFSYGGQIYVGSTRALGTARWWRDREVWRQELGVYGPLSEVLTETIDNCRLHPYHIHISRDDPNLVAYTPNTEDGVKDRRVKLTVGKLLRKLLPLITDNHIQQLEASHRSEMDPTFLIARTPEEILRVYTAMAGDSGCMRYAGEHWALKEGFHPSMAYSYAGLGVAYTEANGIIKSRSVIYDNPDKPSDKRFVRIYGDRSLRRKLELAGYRQDSLQGAKLRAVKMTDARLKSAQAEYRDRDNHYLVPYLDGPGGQQSTEEGSYGYIIRGEDCIRLIDDDQASRLHRMVGCSVPRLKDTGARFEVPTVEASRLQFTCPLSDTTVNVLDDGANAVDAWVDGKVVKVTEAGAAAAGYEEIARHFPEGSGSIHSLWAKPDQLKEPEFFLDQMRYGYWFPANDRQRTVIGYRKLSEAHGYEPNTWVWKNEAIDDGAGGFIRKGDAIMVFEANGDARQVHVGQIEAMKKTKKYTSIAPKGEAKAISHVDNPHLVRTRGNRKCVLGWHAVVQLFDGTWDYAVNATRRYLFDIELWYPNSEQPNPLVLNEAAVRRRLDWVRMEYSVAHTDRRKRLLQDMTRDLLNYGYEGWPFARRGDMVSHRTSTNLSELRGAVERFATMTDEEIGQMLDQHYVQFARGFQVNGAVILKVMDAMLAEFDAEARGETVPAPAPALTPTDPPTADPVVGSLDERMALAA